MTLGRTPAGAIKIKTDAEGGGLRAVECGCCGPCDPCTGVELSNPLLDTIKASTSVLVSFNFPGFTPDPPAPPFPYPEVSGSTGNLEWDGVSAYWEDWDGPSSPSVFVSLNGKCFSFNISIAATNRNLNVTPYKDSYPSGPTFPCAPTDPNDPYIQWQFFTADVNGTPVKAWQRPDGMSSFPPAFWPNAIISVTFS